MTENNRGIVYLVGAGPGDPGLITAKGLELLERCDVVVYDNLIPDELLIMIDPTIEKHYVGKRAAKHALPQDQINELLLNLACEGKTVVRLKGSDPLIFGRGGEEAKYLHQHGIPFEIVPGVTAGIAVPAYSGIPCTDREYASMVTFITGHKAVDKEFTNVNWDRAAKIKNGTLVIYMGVGEIENIVNELISHGMSDDTPAAAIQHGTVPSQRVFTTILKELPSEVRKNNVKPPTIFVVGEVVNLHDDLSWFNKGPLFGKRIMVTRPPDQAFNMYRDLRNLGAEVMPYPTIATEPNIDDEGWKRFNNVKNDDKWLILTSENGVRYFFDQLLERYDDIRILANYKIAAIGYGTERAMKKHHLKADFIPSKSTGKILAKEFAEKFDLTKSTVIRTRGNLAEDHVENVLEKAGADVIPLTVYNTVNPSWPVNFKDRLFEYPPDIIIFSSGSTCSGLVGMLTDEELKELIKDKLIVSIGPSTTKIINSHGIDVSLEAKEHSIPGIIKELIEHYK